MACILRISGDDFDVDRFIAESEWKDVDSELLRVYHKGEFINTLNKRRHVDSGFSITVSKAGFEDFEQQQRDAISFLSTYAKSFNHLREYHIDNWHCLDFGLDTFPPNRFSKTYIISPELMRLCAEYNLEIYMSNYFTKKESRRKCRSVRKFNFRNKL